MSSSRRRALIRFMPVLVPSPWRQSNSRSCRVARSRFSHTVGLWKASVNLTRSSFP